MKLSTKKKNQSGTENEENKKIADLSKELENLQQSLDQVKKSCMANIKKSMDSLQEELKTFGEKNKFIQEEERTKNTMRNYMYKDSIIYDDVIKLLNAGIIKKVGNPTGWDQTAQPLHGKSILKIGTDQQTNENGLLIKVPKGHDVLWIRVINDRFNIFRGKPVDDSLADTDDLTEMFAAGFRNLNEISPDGGSSDAYWDFHKWMPIPLRQPGNYMLYCEKNECVISGIAFGKNLWSHAKNSAYAYELAVNGGTNTKNHANWYNDQLNLIEAGKIHKLIVPVVPNGKDKLLYIQEHNNNWEGVMHGEVRINGRQAERFRTSWVNNPFAAHLNSKLYSRYMATIVKAEWIKRDANFVELIIDMTKSNHNIYFREIGTHDYF